MDQNTKDKTLEVLTKSENILIVVSQDLGFDGLASGLALYLSLVKLDKNVSIVAQEPKVADAQRLYAVDRVGRKEAGKNPVIVVENAVETVDKVTYSLDGTKLKVVIHPLPGTVQIAKDQISVEYTASPADLIFSIGQTSLHDLRNDIVHEQQINPESWIININNQQVSQKFAQVEFVDSQAVSVSEVCAKMIQDLALPMDEDIAYNLYSALSQTTDNFSPIKTTEQTLNVAAWLIKFGAGRASLARVLERAQPFEQFPQIPPPPAGLPEDIDIFNKVIPSAKPSAKDWLKPPKIYKGSKSFDGEN